MKRVVFMVRVGMLTMATVVWARSGEAGERWSLFPIYGGGFAQNVIFTRNPNVAYLTIDVGGPYRSDDGCRTWRPLHGNLPYEMRLKHLDMARSLSADPRDENNIVCASGSTPDAMGGIIVSRDGGRTWHQTAVGNYLGNGRRRVYGQILDRNPSNPDELVVGGDCTGLMKSTDNGETWRPVGLDDHWFCCVFYDRAVKGRVWACAPGYEDVPGEAEAVRKGRDPNPKPRYGRKRGLYRSDDGGETWTRLEMKRIPTELCQIAGSTRVLGIFDEQDVRATEDGGATWRGFSQGLPRLAPGVKVWDNYGVQRGRYWAIGAGRDFYVLCDTRGNPFRRGAGDVAWTAIKIEKPVCTEPEKEMRDYDCMPAACSVVVNPHDERKWYVTDWYSVWESVDAGVHWHSRIHGAQQLVPFTIASSPFDANVVFYATADSRMYVSHDAAKSFEKMKGDDPLGESVNSVAFSRVTPGLVLVTGGKFNPSVRLSRDDGRTWTLCSTNGLPAIKPDWEWSMKDGFYAPFTVAAHPKRDEFYLVMGGVVGKGKGGIYCTRDDGRSWSWFGEGLPEGANLFKFQEWGNGEAIAVSESGDMMCWDMNGTRVFRRGPEDARWTAVSFKMGVVDVVSGRTVQASIKAAPGRPGWFFASSGEGRGALFRSMDGGRTFVKMAGPVGLFAPLAFDLHCPGSFLAAGSGTVYVTQDDGAHFSTLPGGFDYPSSFEPQFFLDRGRVWAFGGAGNGAWVYQDGAPIYPVSGN